MQKPPTQKKIQHGFIQSALRMPPDLHAELKESAEINDRSLNSEILARLRDENVKELLRQNIELKAMVREILDIVRDKL